MEWYATLFVAVGLAMDAFAVSLGIGTSQVANSPRPLFRLSFHMGLFQGLMTFLGWLAGSTIARYISAVDHWVALVLLAFVGIRMIRSGLDPESELHKTDPSRGGTLLVICIATSIDAMAVGLGLAMLKTGIIFPSVVIAVVTLGLSLFGLLAGNSLGEKFGKRMEVLGGLILLAIGLRIVYTHLFI
jgi:manganese efflux pump family protein